MQHKIVTSVSFWHDAPPDAEHPEEASKRDFCMKLYWSKNPNREARVTPIKVEKSRDLNIGRCVEEAKWESEVQVIPKSEDPRSRIYQYIVTVLGKFRRYVFVSFRSTIY